MTYRPPTLDDFPEPDVNWRKMTPLDYIAPPTPAQYRQMKLLERKFWKKTVTLKPFWKARYHRGTFWHNRNKIFGPFWEVNYGRPVITWEKRQPTRDPYPQWDYIPDWWNDDVPPAKRRKV